MPKWFKKEEEIIDYTDRGKNVPEIKTGYNVTKDGFIEFKDNLQNNSSTSNSILNLSANSSETSAFDFLNNMALSSSNDKILNNSEFANEDLSDLRKMIRDVSSMSEQNSNEMYKLLQRIEIIEKKLGIV